MPCYQVRRLYFVTWSPRKVYSTLEFFHYSGVARGTGWQRIGGYASLGSYYLVGIPLGWILCFVMKLRGKGLWIGILIASTIQLSVFTLVTFFTNWEQEVYKLLIFFTSFYGYSFESGFGLSFRQREPETEYSRWHHKSKATKRHKLYWKRIHKFYLIILQKLFKSVKPLNATLLVYFVLAFYLLILDALHLHDVRF